MIDGFGLENVSAVGRVIPEASPLWKPNGVTTTGPQGRGVSDPAGGGALASKLCCLGC